MPQQEYVRSNPEDVTDRREAPAVNSLNKDAVKRVYRWYAPFYNLVFGRVLEAGRVEMARIVGKYAPQRLLEVGVGTGLALPRYPAGAEIFGIDLSFEMLERAQAVVHRLNPASATLVCADAEQLPFADGAFDCVTLPYVLSVTPNPPRLLAELRRVCKPGGHILVLGHFRGAGVWRPAERLVAPLADRVGFHSNLTMDVLDSPEWQIVNVRKVNLFGLSRLVEARNASG